MTDALTGSGLALRQRAENRLQVGALARGQSAQDLSALTTKKILQELQVQQIELEIQNDELLRTQTELHAAKARYFDLYDLAPVGYCTLSEQGIILEANVAAASLLGAVRIELPSRPLHRFIAKTSQDRYYLSLKALTKSRVSQECELQVSLQPCDEHSEDPWVQMCMSAALSNDGLTVLRVVFTTFQSANV